MTRGTEFLRSRRREGNRDEREKREKTEDWGAFYITVLKAYDSPKLWTHTHIYTHTFTQVYFNGVQIHLCSYVFDACLAIGSP